MNRIPYFMAATLIAIGAAAHAGPGQEVNLDGSSSTAKKPSLAAAANRQLQQADVPSVKTEPADMKAKADADIASRNARPKGRHLQVQRQILKGDDAAHALAQQTTPNTIDHDTAYGDKDHTEQVTNLKVTIKK